MRKKVEATLWDYIKSIYFSKFRIPSIVIEYVAVFDILTLFIIGLSNFSISLLTNFPEDYIRDVLKSNLGSYGWYDDLDCVPYLYYVSSNGDMVVFENMLMNATNKIRYDHCSFIYNLCIKFNKIRLEINRYYV